MWSWAAALAWGGCPKPTHNVDVADAIDEAMAYYASFDTAGFDAAVGKASDAAACLADVVSPDVAAGFHRVRGLQAFLAKDFGNAEHHFAAARMADPEFTWSEDLAPESGPLRRRYNALSVDGGVPIPVPSSGSLRVDGRVASSRPEGVPAVVQSVAASGQTLSTRVVAPKAPLPIDDLRFRAHAGRPYFLAAAACGVLAAGTYGVAMLQKAGYEEAAATGDAGRIASRASSARGLTVASGILAASGGAFVGVGLAFR